MLRRAPHRLGVLRPSLCRSRSGVPLRLLRTRQGAVLPLRPTRQGRVPVPRGRVPVRQGRVPVPRGRVPRFRRGPAPTQSAAVPRFRVRPSPTQRGAVPPLRVRPARSVIPPPPLRRAGRRAAAALPLITPRGPTIRADRTPQEPSPRALGVSPTGRSRVPTGGTARPALETAVNIEPLDRRPVPRADRASLDSAESITPRAGRASLDSAESITPRAGRASLDSAESITPRAGRASLDSAESITPRAGRASLDSAESITPRDPTWAAASAAAAAVATPAAPVRAAAIGPQAFTPEHDAHKRLAMMARRDPAFKAGLQSYVDDNARALGRGSASIGFWLDMQELHDKVVDRRPNGRIVPAPLAQAQAALQKFADRYRSLSPQQQQDLHAAPAFRGHFGDAHLSELFSAQPARQLELVRRLGATALEAKHYMDARTALRRLR